MVSDWDFVTDFVSVGSGGGGLVGALTARAAGYEALVIEKQGVVGGSTAKSGGALWIPNNPIMGREGVADSYEDAMSYFDEVVGDVGPGSSFERRDAFIRQGTHLVSFLEDHGVNFIRCKGYPDYYPDAKGASLRGRSIEAQVFNGRLLGPWFDKLEHGVAWDMLGLAVYFGELTALVNFNRSASSLATSARVWARTKLALARGQVPLVEGWSFVAQLLNAAIEAGVIVRTRSCLRDVVVEDGRAVGILVERAGRVMRIAARAGVLLAAGGFSHNVEMRKRYLDPAATTDWSRANAGDTGETIEIAIAHGAATSLTDEAIWTPAKVIGGMPVPDMERYRAGSIMVDVAGERFCNEANSYQEVCQAQLERNRKVKAVPAWLIFDDAFRKRYVFRKGRPGVVPEEWYASGGFVTAQSLDALAERCGIDQIGLRATIDRYNPNAAVGVDPEYHKGGTAYNHRMGDPNWKPNNCLATIQRPPFYAAPIYPSDVGTCGGVLADEHARVVTESGDLIPGLYATGNMTASVMGRMYLGAGASISNSSVFGRIAALHAMTTKAARRSLRSLDG